MMQITPMVRNLLIMNGVIFVMTTMIFPESVLQFALYNFESSKFRPYQLITHMFLHGGFSHLFMNMFSLFIFGPMLEHHWGSNRFLTFYLITGLGASLLYQGVRGFEMADMRKDVQSYISAPSPLAFKDFLDEHFPGKYNVRAVAQYQRNADNPELIRSTIESVKEIYETVKNVPMLGASGAVFGILMAFGMLFPNTELMLLFFPVPIKAKYFVLMYGALELYSGLARTPGDNVAHFAHLGGMLFAYILLKYWERNDRKNFY